MNGTVEAAGRSSLIAATEAVEAPGLDPVAVGNNRLDTTHVGGVGIAGDLPLEGDIRQVSIVMADLRGYTAFCECVSPSRTSRVLNEYLTAMVDVIFKQGGLVQDFVGDGILGVFGAPRPDAQHAWHAALCALEMQLAIRHLGLRWQRQEAMSFSLGVAVHSGEVFAGTVGSPRKMKYAVVGDPVNTVARLEELNRSLGTEIVMSGDTLALVRDRVDVHPKGLFSLRGRRHTVEVYELLCIRRPHRGVAQNGLHSTSPLVVSCHPHHVHGNATGHPPAHASDGESDIVAS